MHERRYQSAINELRDSERVNRLGLQNITQLSLSNKSDIKSLLDIGTGSGLFAQQFVNLGIQVTGLDVNPEMVKAAMQFLPKSNFQVGIAEKLPFQNDSFDMAFMGFLLHETDDYVAAMKEAYRVVRHRLTVLEWPDVDQSNGPPSHHRLSADQILNFAKEAGFSKYKKYSVNSAVLYNFEKNRET